MPQLFILAAIAVFAFGDRAPRPCAHRRGGRRHGVVRARSMHWMEVIALAIGLAVLCVVLFVQLLGQPFMVWPF